MTITDEDLQLYAARVRAHFPPHLRNAAEVVAYGIARAVGPKVKELRPETTVSEILGWTESLGHYSQDSVDTVEWIMALEEEFEFEIPDYDSERAKTMTFQDWIEGIARQSKRV